MGYSVSLFNDTIAWFIFFIFKFIFTFVHLAALGLNWGTWDLVPRPGDWTCAPSLSHWTTREVPWNIFKLDINTENQLKE